MRLHGRWVGSCLLGGVGGAVSLLGGCGYGGRTTGAVPRYRVLIGTMEQVLAEYHRAVDVTEESGE